MDDEAFLARPKGPERPSVALGLRNADVGERQCLVRRAFTMLHATDKNASVQSGPGGRRADRSCMKLQDFTRLVIRNVLFITIERAFRSGPATGRKCSECAMSSYKMMSDLLR